MKKQIVIGLSTALLALPALALAETSVGLGANANAKADIHVGDVDADGQLDVQAQGETRDMDSDDDGINDKSGKPTLYGARAEEHGTTSAGWNENKGKNDDSDNDSDKGGDNEAKGWGKGGIVGFFRSMFGLDGSAKMADIRADLEATTTASADVSKSNGLGFWARIWGLFKVGNDD